MERQNNLNYLSLQRFFFLKIIGQFGKNKYLCIVIELERHIEILLLSNDCVIVPGFGGFMAHHVDARYDGRDNTFLPPLRTIGFNPQLQINDSLLAQSYVEAYDISYPEALARIESEVAEVRQELETTGKFELSNIGVLYLNESGNYSFEPCEAGILTPELYGLGGFNMLPLSSMETPVTVEVAKNNEVEEKQEESKAKTIAITPSVFDDEEEDEQHAEFIQIKKSVLRNLAAACIAIVAFFALSTPLNSPNKQMSKVDTSLLTRIMPKEVTRQNVAQELSTGNNANSLKLEEKASNALDEKEIKSAEPYYSIVLASRVTKRNAASYVERLQAKGLKDAKVIITASNVKVVYGTFDSENEAQVALNKLRHNEVFSDGWITKIKE